MTTSHCTRNLNGKSNRDANTSIPHLVVNTGDRRCRFPNAVTTSHSPTTATPATAPSAEITAIVPRVCTTSTCTAFGDTSGTAQSAAVVATSASHCTTSAAPQSVVGTSDTVTTSQYVTSRPENRAVRDTAPATTFDVTAATTTTSDAVASMGDDATTTEVQPVELRDDTTAPATVAATTAVITSTGVTTAVPNLGVVITGPLRRLCAQL